MDESKQGHFEFSLQWQSGLIHHTERSYFSKVNFWRDCFPGELAKKIADIKLGETVSEQCEPGTFVEPFDKNRVYKFHKRKFNLEKLAANGIHFHVGRFYPRSALASAGFTSADMRPFRVLDNLEEHIIVDINHPFCSYPSTVSGTLLKSLPNRLERGGNCTDIGYDLAENGPGLQADLADLRTDFFSDQPFTRLDEKSDAFFYQDSRMVDHIDQKARDQVSALYGRFLQPGMKGLDLMSSWNSHLPEMDGNISVTGLGLNEEELRKNPQLNERIISDLNATPLLPFPENSFDVAVCTVSVEYLVQPIAVFKEVGRVLKPGAPFIVTFSDRWFPPKVIRIWIELHPFERLSLVQTYFREAGTFEKLNTETVRGYPRSVTDPHFGQRPDSDPLFAVWGFAK